MFEEAALVRDVMLGRRSTPTRAEILSINGTGLLSYAVPVGQTVDSAEVVPSTEDDRKTLRDMARRGGENLPDED